MEDIRKTVAEIATDLSREHPFEVVFERGEEITVELYAPVGTDLQKPHGRDELYIVVAGNGVFRRGDERVEFAEGDLLYVPAHVDHRFEEFTEDFKSWVIFYGPRREP